MTLKIEQYDRRPVSIQAVLITEENIEEVGEWCKGEIHRVTSGGAENTFILLTGLKSVASARHRSAYVGDYVVKYEDGTCRVYTTAALRRNYLPKRRTKWKNNDNIVVNLDQPPNSIDPSNPGIPPVSPAMMAMMANRKVRKLS